MRPILPLPNTNQGNSLQNQAATSGYKTILTLPTSPPVATSVEWISRSELQSLKFWIRFLPHLQDGSPKKVPRSTIFPLFLFGFWQKTGAFLFSFVSGCDMLKCLIDRIDLEFVSICSLIGPQTSIHTTWEGASLYSYIGMFPGSKSYLLRSYLDGKSSCFTITAFIWLEKYTTKGTQPYVFVCNVFKWCMSYFFD